MAPLKKLLLFLPFLLWFKLGRSQTSPLDSQEFNWLSKALQFQTISCYDSAAFNPVPFKNFIHFLQESFRLIHTRLQWKSINNYSLIYHWKGEDVSLQPVLFLGHFDVVPAEEKTLKEYLQCIHFYGSLIKNLNEERKQQTK